MAPHTLHAEERLLSARGGARTRRAGCGRGTRRYGCSLPAAARGPGELAVGVVRVVTAGQGLQSELYKSWHVLYLLAQIPPKTTGKHQHYPSMAGVDRMHLRPGRRAVRSGRRCTRVTYRWAMGACQVKEILV